MADFERSDSRERLSRPMTASILGFEHSDSPQRRFWLKCETPAFEDLPQYRYSIYVTNSSLPVDQIWNIYNGRADCESRIKELKYDFGLDCFCLQGFWATEAAFRFIILAYKILALFWHVALNHNKTATLKTVRSYCFA